MTPPKVRSSTAEFASKFAPSVPVGIERHFDDVKTDIMKVFRDRADAGRQLASRLTHYRAQAQTIVLALPRGGVPVAAEIARAHSLPLDVLVVRKLGAPGQPELAMGAIASGGAVVMNADVLAYFANQPELVHAITAREQQELQRRELAYRGDRQPLHVQDGTVIVVDDGAATGATMRAAVQALRAIGASRIVVALPIASAQAKRALEIEADEVICLRAPADFFAVGQWYDDFSQTDDAEVRETLERCRCGRTSE